jgi:riboflavin kinase/FMN adenylyltransferase
MMMQIYRTWKSLPEKARGSVLALGNFDGVHRGHQSILSEAQKEARKQGVPFAVMTFEPHPRQFFNRELRHYRLTTLSEKLHFFRGLGVEMAFVLPFTHSFRKLTAWEFMAQVLVDGLAIQGLVTGENFKFGNDREGDHQTLGSFARKMGFAYHPMPVLHAGGVVCSSSQIREYLKRGEIAQAERLLGRPYSLMGRVVKGDGRGRLLGFPTANLHLQDRIIPASGVYAVKAALFAESSTHEVEELLHGVTNIGHRPTFNGNVLSCETHLFGETGNLYGRKLHVQLLHRLRGEERFSGPEALITQIHQDIAQAKNLLSPAA